MSNFDDFGFGQKSANSNKQNNDFTETAKELADGLESFLAPYKDIMIKEFKSLDKNNENWKKSHNGEDCEAFIKKQWAISAPFNALKIYRDLYVNRKN